MTDRPAARPLVMGVLNVTPDSFSDGGRYADARAALDRALAMIAEGADMIDVGGESTRPGAEPVSEAEEIARVVPVIRALRARFEGPIGVDTMKPAAARAAVAEGATIWNDVSALRFAPDSLETAADLGCEVVLMHMQGDPRTMQDAPAYGDVAQEVADFLAERVRAATDAGIAREKIRLDPGIGFGKTAAHNLALLRGLDRIAALGFPILLGVSRKRFVQAIDPSAADPADRLGGSLAAALWGAAKGVEVLRVHDVRETAQAVRVWRAIAASGREEP